MVSITSGHLINLPAWEGLMFIEFCRASCEAIRLTEVKSRTTLKATVEIEHEVQDMNRRSLLAAPAIGLLASPFAALEAFASLGSLTLIKDPDCGCCEGHASYLEAHGFTVTIEEAADLNAVRTKYGVPPAMAGCHTILADSYVIEGHVPAAAIKKLLAERPMVKGISVPGMPEGSPGMSGEKTGPLVVYVIQDGAPRIFMME